ncbi:cob(I)alamin adenosyltransferase/cobinamide ATP-dependent adenosyltransferase [Desulfosarcina alkanivorans]|uniref:corrinoid adenosyltransferase n=1 Tax=Desulfosarcina alkanivorans TaxID=571177 RepID=A0A5K7YMM9_9BACT|nr:cob(I)yrinic acid a,c-diamide adenosyltransferase [Desulfosarcina alkanivorans]BBO67614.1 cob(I)alamin adenosyltransferase/cobinamide ATP-dependent adenosyltransferase [Desulfosarcina alkanivorans]
MTAPARQTTDTEPGLDRGFVHVYTGDGKGKTSAAVGLAIRALGSGLRVAVAQFMKTPDSGECRILENLDGRIHLAHFGSGCFIHGVPENQDILRARQGYRAIRQMIDRRRFDLVILDEANMAVCCGLLTVDALLDLIRSKPVDLELVITGRCAHPRIIEAADLVTEMVEVKHYYRQGVKARPGIDM